MFSRHRKSLTTSEIKTGQSLFDFLKSKKKSGLDDSFVKSRVSKNHSITNDHLDDSSFDLEAYELANTNTERKFESTTPKKVTFIDKSQTKPASSSFVKMISPISKRQNSKPKDEQEFEARPTSILKSSGKKKMNKSDTFTRKSMNDSIKILKETIQKLMSEGKKIKNKSHALFIEIKPLLKSLEEGNNLTLSRKAQQAKESLRTFQFLLKEFETEQANQIVESFHRELSQHIVATQAKVKGDYEQWEMEGFNKLKGQKDEEINEILRQKRQLEQTIENLTKRLDKAERLSKDQQLRDEEKEQDLKEESSQQINRLQSIIEKLEEGNQELKEELFESRSEQKRSEKEAKDAIFARQEIQKRLIEQNCKVKSEREEFLLGEIMMMKTEFSKDMRELTQLYSSKESDQNLLIEELRSQIKELKAVRESEKENILKVSSDQEGMRNLVNKYKRQNECLVTDMHRMNEELYQHWLALKDVRTLACRLHLMPKFARIYEDLPFNDQLFS